MKTSYLILIFAALSFSAHAKLNVVATTPDFGAIAREIGGEAVEVTTLAKPTEDSHFVEAKPSFIVKLNRADALIEGGAELEDSWLAPLLSGARNPKLSPGKPGRISSEEGIPMLEIPVSLDRSKGDLHASGNPHYTTDPANAKVVADHIATSFCQIDAGSCDVFKANLKTFNERLDPKLIEWKKILAPHEGERVVTYHNSWPYFAKRFGLKMDLFLEPKPGIPPSPAHLAAVITKMKAENTKVIIVEPHMNQKTAVTIANRTGAVILDFAPYPNNGSSYIDWMDGLVKSLAKALDEKK